MIKDWIEMKIPDVTEPEEQVTAPLVVSYGMGVDSTAMLVGFAQRGIRPDLIQFADTGSEKPETYEYLGYINMWLEEVGFPLINVVTYSPAKTKYGHYSTLGENCIRNATLPSLAFGFKSCSLKWKVGPQNKFCDQWEPAKAAWAAGLKVTKAIGYDCSAKDSKRYAHSGGKEDPKYSYIYPLRDWGWDRTRCEAEILKAGLPLPIKSACYFCPASKPAELQFLQPHELRAIVIIEARAKPELTAIQGLWRNGNKGTKTGTPLPGRMSDYIESEGLLPVGEVARLQSVTPLAKDYDHELLTAFLDRELDGHKA